MLLTLVKGQVFSYMNTDSFLGTPQILLEWDF